MSRPWMPLYCEKFRTKTDHLGAAETGAYMSLIMYYWINRGLPQGDRALARIARMSEVEWAEHRESIASFFNEDWSHDFVEEELRKSDEAYERRANAGARGGNTPKSRKAKPEKKQCLSNAESETEAGRNLEHLLSSSNEEDSSELRSGADAPSDAMDEDDPKSVLFSDGLRWLAKAQGKSEAKLRPLVGKMLSDIGGDTHAAQLLGIFRDAKTERKADPVSWIQSMVKGRSARAGPSPRRNGHIEAHENHLRQQSHEPDRSTQDEPDDSAVTHLRLAGEHAGGHEEPPRGDERRLVLAESGYAERRVTGADAFSLGGLADSFTRRWA